MNILCFKEGSKLLPEDLKNQIASKTQMDVPDILKKLELAHVLKHRLPKMDVGEINLEEEIEKFEDKEYYSFKYVGILMINDLFLIIYPKYIRDVKKDFYGDKHKLLQIMQVIDKYQSVYTYDTDSEENLGSFLALQIKIIREYFNAGLYSTDEVIMELNGEGPTSWEQTINENIAYLVDDIPFYFDIFTQKKILNEMDIIRRIHASILTEISRNLAPILSIFGLKSVILNEEDKNDFGSNNYLEYLIDQELSRQFITSKQVILNDLKRYIWSKEEHANDDIEMYGTSSFNLVWEDICKTVYRDNLNDSLKNLTKKGLKIEGKNKEGEYLKYNKNRKSRNGEVTQNKLKNIVDRPIWTDEISYLSTEVNKTLELDVLHVDFETKQFEIYDGKYYTIEFISSISDQCSRPTIRVTGQPGVSDVTKQYLYQLAYKNLAEINDFRFTNTFIVPKDEFKKVRDIIATVKMEMFSAMGLEDIKVVARDCETFYNEYLAKDGITK